MLLETKAKIRCFTGSLAHGTNHSICLLFQWLCKYEHATKLQKKWSLVHLLVLQRLFQISIGKLVFKEVAVFVIRGD